MADWPSLTDVYLDTSVVVPAVVAGLEYAEVCVDFCAALVRQGTRVYFSQLLRVEYAQTILKLGQKRRHQLPVELRKQYGLDQWASNAMVRQQWMALGVLQLETFLATFTEVFELPFRQQIWERSVSIMAFDQLDSHDAIHVATALEYGLRDFATTDADFQELVAPTVHLIR